MFFIHVSASLIFNYDCRSFPVFFCLTILILFWGLVLPVDCLDYVELCLAPNLSPLPYSALRVVIVPLSFDSASAYLAYSLFGLNSSVSLWISALWSLWTLLFLSLCDFLLVSSSENILGFSTLHFLAKRSA